MRCTTLIVSLAFLYATTATPIDSVIPEDANYALDDDLSEAQATLDQMTADGKSEKDCRKLVDETKKDITTVVTNGQKIINELPTGGHCMNLGLGLVTKTREEKRKADAHVVTTTKEVNKASSAEVDFGSASFSSLTEGQCGSFYSSTNYINAKTTYKTAVSTRTKAVGAAGEAKVALENAIKAAADAKHKCLCKTRADHDKAFKAGSASNAANEKAWIFAHKLECVLNRVYSGCKIPDTPTVKRATLTSAAQGEKC